jgi:hypothetical protein
VGLLNGLLDDPDVSRVVVNEVAPEIIKKFQEPLYNLLDAGLDDAREILAVNGQ